MRNKLLLIAIIAMSGCATVSNDARHGAQHVGDTGSDIVSSIPNAIGTVVGAAIFGGTVSQSIDAGWYMRESINRETRIFLNKQRRATQKEIAKQIQ